MTKKKNEPNDGTRVSRRNKKESAPRVDSDDSKPKTSHADSIEMVLRTFENLFFDKFGIKPEVQVKTVAILVSGLLKRHSAKGICRIIELYFEDSANENRVYHLPGILSSFIINKYIPKMRYNPMMYSDADKLNEDLY